MISDLVSLLAEVRPTEVWTAGSIAAALLLLGSLTAAFVAWVIHVMARR